MANENPQHGVQVETGAGEEGIPPGDQPSEIGFRPGLEFKDLRANEETLEKVREFAGTKMLRYEGDRDDLEQWWKDADYMWTGGINDTKRASDQTDTTKANTGDGIFFRQVRTLASQDLSIWFSQKDPYTYGPPENENIESSDAAGEPMANQRNMLARYTRREDDIDRKVFDIMFTRRKYGNQFFLCEWERCVSKVIEKIRDRDGSFTWTREHRIVKDCPTLIPWPIGDVYADRNVGTVQRQNCIVLTRLVDAGFLHSQAQAGFYKDINEVEDKHFWKGSEQSGASGSADLRETQMENRGLDPSAEDTQSGQFKEYNCYLHVPIDEDGVWSDTAPPDWVHFTFIHDIRTGPCVRGEVTRDPDGECPAFMDHVYPDDPDLFYHIGDATITNSDYNEKVTRKNQYIDNLNEINNRPMMAVEGEVYSDDVTYESEKVIIVESLNSLREMDVLDTSNSAITMLNYLDDTSNKNLGTISTITGEGGLGARASANEAEKVYRGASKPHTMLAKYHFSGWPAWYARKKMRLWDVYGDPDRIIRLTHEKQMREIRLGDLYGNFEVIVDLVDQFSEDLVQDENLAFVNQSVIPHLLPWIEGAEWAKTIFERFHFDPIKLVKQHQDVDASYFARLRIMVMVDEGKYESPRVGENLQGHLREAEAYLLRFSNLDRNALDGDPRLKNLDLVEQYVEELKFMIQQQSSEGGQIPAPPGNESEGEVAGNAIAARSPGSLVG